MMDYIHAGPAVRLAGVPLQSSCLSSINKLLEACLRTAVDRLSSLDVTGQDVSQIAVTDISDSINTPTRLADFRQAILQPLTSASVAGTIALLKESLLEAEVETAEWVKRRGRTSDPALVGHALARRGSSSSNLLLSNAERDDTYATREEVFDQLRLALVNLSELGARSGFVSTSAASRAAAAIQLCTASPAAYKHISPLLCVYVNPVLKHIAAYILKACGAYVDDLPVRKADSLSSQDWLDVVAHNAALAGLVQAYTNNQQRDLPRIPSSDDDDVLPVVLRRKSSLRGKMARRHHVYTGQGDDKAAITDGELASTPLASPDRISSIPIRQSPTKVTHDLQTRTSAAHSDGNKASNGLTLEGLPQARPSTSSSSSARTAVAGASQITAITTTTKGSRKSTSSTTSARERALLSPSQPHSNLATTTGDFDKLIMGDRTVKMSLTPSRFRTANGKNTAGITSRSASDSQIKHHASAPPSSLRPSSSANFRVTRLAPRAARGIREESSSSATENDTETLTTEDEALDALYDDEDLVALGIAPTGRTASKRFDGQAGPKGRKESLQDILNSEPPWSGPEKSQSVPSSRSASSPATSVTRIFAPISNLHQVLGAPAAQLPPVKRTLRPDTAASLRPSTAGSALDVQALDNFPTPPSAQSIGNDNSPRPSYLSSHKSSPNLYAQSNYAFPSEQSSVRPTRRLMAKDERQVGTKGATDDLINFFANAPPPSALNLASSAHGGKSEPNTPSAVSSMSKKNRIKGFLKKNSISMPQGAVPLSFFGSGAKTPGNENQEYTEASFSSVKSAATSRKNSDAGTVGASDHSKALHRKLSRNRLNSGRVVIGTNGIPMPIQPVQHAQQAYLPADTPTSAHSTARLLTPENSKDNLYNIRRSSAENVTPTAAKALDTPPDTPPDSVNFGQQQTPYRKASFAPVDANVHSAIDQRRPSAISTMTTHSARSDVSAQMSQASTALSSPTQASPARAYRAIYEQQYKTDKVAMYPVEPAPPAQIAPSSPSSTSKHERRTSWVKRKPTPRWDAVADKQELRSHVEEGARPQHNRATSSASQLSTSVIVERLDASVLAVTLDQQSATDLHSRQTSYNSAYFSKSLPAHAPVAHTHMHSYIETAPSSSAASVTDALPAASRRSSKQPGTSPSLTQHAILASMTGNENMTRTLMALRHEMSSARSVEDCLSLVDAAIFEMAYDIRSPAESVSDHLTFNDAQNHSDKATRAIEAPLRPIVRSSQVTNRALNAILEHHIASFTSDVDFKYPRGWHRVEPTALCPLSASSAQKTRYAKRSNSASTMQ